MKKFDVEITETLQRKVSVEAASQEDAERMVTQAWNNQDYVLDSGDFTGVDFKTVGEHELAETRTMDVLLVQPNAYPKKISVGTELEDLQAMVGGDIEVTYPFEDEVAIILNESGKINGHNSWHWLCASRLPSPHSSRTHLSSDRNGDGGYYLHSTAR